MNEIQTKWENCMETYQISFKVRVNKVYYPFNKKTIKEDIQTALMDLLKIWEIVHVKFEDLKIKKECNHGN